MVVALLIAFIDPVIGTGADHRHRVADGIHGLLPGGMIDLECSQRKNAFGVDASFLIHLEGTLDQGAQLRPGVLAPFS